MCLTDIALQRWHIFRDLTPPFCILREEALRRNETWMSEFCHVFGVGLAPHGKTSMSPQVFKRQFDQGAWAITLATPLQVRVARKLGIGRIILANQLIEKADISCLLKDMSGDADYEFYCLVDSLEGVKRLRRGCEQHPVGRPINVFLECGYAGGRTGCRNLESALEVAEAVKAASPLLSLAGIEAFEGLLQSAEASHGLATVDALLQFCVKVAEECDQRELFRTDSVILSAGGSAFYDRVSQCFHSANLRRSHKIILRSGCYLTHDAGIYAKSMVRIRDRVAASLNAASPSDALEVVGTVLSRPEATRAIVNFGRRDVGHDSGLPIPRYMCAPGQNRKSMDLKYTVAAINDQHIHLTTPAEATLAVGDRVGFAISHPCTTFDKWKLVYVVDQHDQVIEAITTIF